MSTAVTIKPDSTLGNGVNHNAFHLTGAPGTVHGILADTDESTQIYGLNADGVDRSSGYDAYVTLEDFTLPSLARIEAIQAHLHLVMYGGAPQVAVRAILGTGYSGGAFAQTHSVDTLTHVTVVAGDGTFIDSFFPVHPTTASGGAWDAATIDALAMGIELYDGGLPPGAAGEGATYIGTADVHVIYTHAPVVTVSAPTGTVTVAHPVVAWSVADAEGAPQQSYRVKIFTAAQVAAGGFTPDGTTPVADSGEVYDQVARSWQITTALTDLTSYVAYVRTSKPWGGAGGVFYSAWASHAFAVDIPNSLAPTISRLLADYEQGRVYVEVTVAPSDPYPGTFARIEHSLDNVNWEVCQRGGSVPYDGSGTAIFYDYEVPAEDRMYYRAASVTFIDPDWVTGAYAATESVATLWQTAFLREPTLPQVYNIAVQIAPPYNLTQREAQGVYETLGRATAVVMSDGLRPTKGKLSVWLMDRDAVVAFSTMQHLYKTLRIDLTNGSWGYLRLGADVQYETLRVAAQLGSGRPVRVAYKVTADFITVERPQILNLLTLS